VVKSPKFWGKKEKMSGLFLGKPCSVSFLILARKRKEKGKGGNQRVRKRRAALPR
jgi:hypothetical protein